ncbi:MAG: hypothetical protein V2B19_05875 [Pseudomonadota bacterium]
MKSTLLKFRGNILTLLFFIMGVLTIVPLTAADAETIVNTSNSAVCIKSLTMSPTTTPQVGTPVTISVEASSAGGEIVYYKFFYCGNYGTSLYASSPWTVVQDYSTSNSAQYNFPSAGSYIVVVRAVTDPHSEPADLSIIGETVTVGNAGQVVISNFSSTATPSTKAGDTVTVTATATTQTAAPIYYSFYYCANYGTASYDSTPWTLARNYSTSNSCQISFPASGNYIVVVRAVTDSSNEPAALPIVGTVVRVNAADNSPLGRKVSSTMGLFSTGSDILTPLSTELSAAYTALSNPDSSVPVTITPPMDQINLSNPPSAVTIKLDYGSGYTAADGAQMTGSLQISITGISVTSSGIALSVNVTADQLKRNGVLTLDCDVSLTANITSADNLLSADVSAVFTQMDTLAGSITGQIDIHAAGISLQTGTFQQPITVTFNNLQTAEIDIISGTVVISSPTAKNYQIDANLTTSEGLISGSLLLDMTDETQSVLNSVGIFQTGDYTLDVNDVVFKPETCDAYPISGNVGITSGSEQHTLTFNGVCDAYAFQ